MAKDNTWMWVLGGIVAAGGIYYFSRSKGGGTTDKKERTIMLAVPYPSGTQTKVKESELYKYGYVVEPSDGKVYHSSQYPPTGSNKQVDWAKWASMLQSFMSQGMTAYNAVNEALKPTITITPNWSNNSFSYIVKAGVEKKDGTTTKGTGLGGQINNNIAYEIIPSGNAQSVVTIKKISDESILATKTVDWNTKTVS
jgi:hypothetical protein